jgi:uncharacterized LabA/DUF88 family protein
MAIGLFIDGAYSLKVFPGGILDYTRFRSFLESELNDQIDEAYFFNSIDPEPTDRTKRFYKALGYPPPTGPGLPVKLYWFQHEVLTWPKSMGGMPVVHPQTGVPFEHKTQKAVDVGLVYHMTRSYHHRRWNKLVLLAGDADFHEPIQNLVQSENVELYLVGTMKSMSCELLPYARKVFDLDIPPLSELKFPQPPRAP